MRLAPARAVDEQHVGALGPAHVEPLEVLADVVAGIADVLAQHLAELVHPLVALGTVGAHERVHGEHVHVVVAGLSLDGRYAVAQPAVIYHVVAAHEARQVERLGRRVECHRARAGVGAHALGGDVGVAGQNDIAPNLVGDHVDVVCREERHGPLELGALPHAAGRVVRRAEDRSVDVVLLYLALHVLVVHAPDAGLVGHERAQDDAVAVTLERLGEADVGGAVDKDRVARGSHGLKRRDDASQHAVLVADVRRLETRDAVSRALPVDDRGRVGVRGLEVAKGRVLEALGHGLHDGGAGGEVHVRHPHGNLVEARARRGGRPGHVANAVDGQGILAVALHDGGEVVLRHLRSSLAFSRRSRA